MVCIDRLWLCDNGNHRCRSNMIPNSADESLLVVSVRFYNVLHTQSFYKRIDNLDNKTVGQFFALTEAFNQFRCQFY